VDTSNPTAENQPSRWGYAGAILISALGHVALAVLLLVVLPEYLSAPRSEPPSYTVKIVDELPAGDLGTHLPRLSRRQQQNQPQPKPQPPKQEPQVVTKPNPPPPPDDKNAIALNIKPTSRETPAPAPRPTPVPRPTPTPPPPPSPPTPTEVPTPRPTPKPPQPKKLAAPRPTPKPPERSQKPPHPKPTAAIAIAKVESTPSVKQQLLKLREQLLAEHLIQAKKAAEAATPEPDEGDEGDEEADTSGGGPVVAKAASEGHGAGIGPGQGSMGIQQDLDFLLYYRTVQERVKQAWSFSGGNSDLTTKVAFAIGPDGKVTDLKVTQSSHNSAFDESVIRAIRRAAPFPAPPDKYRDQFARGIEAIFKLGELNS